MYLPCVQLSYLPTAVPFGYLAVVLFCAWLFRNLRADCMLR